VIDNDLGSNLLMSVENRMPAVVPLLMAGIFKVQAAHGHPEWTTEASIKLRRPGVVLLPQLFHWSGATRQGRFEVARDGVISDLGFVFRHFYDDDEHVFKVIVPPLAQWPPDVSGLWLNGYRFWAFTIDEDEGPRTAFKLQTPDGYIPRGNNLEGEESFSSDEEPIQVLPPFKSEHDEDEQAEPDYGEENATLLDCKIFFDTPELTGYPPRPLSVMPRIPLAYRGQLPEEDRDLYLAALPNELWLCLEHRNAALEVVAHDSALFTVAPVIFSSDVDLPLRLISAFLCDYEVAASQREDGGLEPLPVTGNFGFIGDLVHAASQAGAPYTLVNGADIPLKHTGDVADTDLWCRDVCWFGHFVAPHATRPVMVSTPRAGPWLSVSGAAFTPDADTAALPHLFLASRQETINPSTLDSGGNLVVSPPVLHATEACASVPAQPIAPYGKLILGDDCNDNRPTVELRRFLANQRVQPLIPLDTSWLKVKHADEVVSFAKSAVHTVMFMPWPDTAVELLLPLAGLEGVRPMRRPALAKETNPGLYLDLTVAALIAKFTLQEGSLVRMAHPFAQKLDQAHACLSIALNLEEEGIELVRLPVLFDPDRAATEAVLPNMVNMLPLGDHLLIPKPWGPRVSLEVAATLNLTGLPASLLVERYWKKPCQEVQDIVAALQCQVEDVTEANEGRPEEWAALPYRWDAVPAGWRLLKLTHATVDVFEAYLHKTLTPLGFTLHFIDDWDRYHVNSGEVHCATNVKRAPHDPGADLQWWNVYEDLAACEPYPGCCG
jgi:hypothetical protein